jgi:hypothetical protein
MLAQVFIFRIVYEGSLFTTLRKTNLEFLSKNGLKIEQLESANMFHADLYFNFVISGTGSTVKIFEQ